jgi:hypothetical protein
VQRRLLYTSPIDDSGLESWPSLAGRLKRAVAATCGGDVEVKTGERPVFGYGTDVDETLAGLEEEVLAPREVRVDLWSSICRYAAVSFTLGPAIRRQERRELMRRLKKKELAGETFLGEAEGRFHLDQGRVYGYSISPADDRGKSTIEHLLIPFDTPLYIGEHWLLQGGDEQVDTASYEVVVRVGPNHAIFLANDPEAAERAWEASTHGEGLIAFYGDDPAEPEIRRRFSRSDDLVLFLAEKPWAGQRVAIGRCRPEDSLVVVYGPPYAPEIDEPILFMI